MVMSKLPVTRTLVTPVVLIPQLLLVSWPPRLFVNLTLTTTGGLESAFWPKALAPWPQRSHFWPRQRRAGASAKNAKASEVILAMLGSDNVGTDNPSNFTLTLLQTKGHNPGKKRSLFQLNIKRMERGNKLILFWH